MKQHEFYVNIFKMHDVACNISHVLDSIGKVENREQKDAMVCNITKFIDTWYTNNMKLYRGWFWQVRKRILRRILDIHYFDLTAQLNDISTSTVNEE